MNEPCPPCCCEKTRTRSYPCLACILRQAVADARALEPDREVRDILLETHGPYGWNFWQRGVLQAKKNTRDAREKEKAHVG